MGAAAAVFFESSGWMTKAGMAVNAKAVDSAVHCPVFGCTPDQFPDLMAVALTGRDIEQWAASREIALVRGQ